MRNCYTTVTTPITHVICHVIVALCIYWLALQFLFRTYSPSKLVILQFKVVFIPWKKTWRPTPVLLPAESMGRAAWQAIVHTVQRVGHNWINLTHMHTEDVFSPAPNNNDWYYQQCIAYYVPRSVHMSYFCHPHCDTVNWMLSNPFFRWQNGDF